MGWGSSSTQKAVWCKMQIEQPLEGAMILAAWPPTACWTDKGSGVTALVPAARLRPRLADRLSPPKGASRGRRFGALLMLLLLLAFGGSGQGVAAFDARVHIAKAVGLIEQGRHALARVWLDPALVAPGLHSSERSRAYYLRGFSFQADGFSVSAAQDYARAIEFNPDNPVALNAMGHMHSIGAGAPPQPELALAFFKAAAELGHADSQFRTGHAYLQGAGALQDVDEARVWLQRAAEQGHGPAMTQLGFSYRANADAGEDPSLARHWYERAAEVGELDALVALGYMARDGEMECSFPSPSPSPSCNQSMAADYFQRAAEQGSAVGMVNLAHAYLTGQGVEQDFAAARTWFTQAAEMGAAGSFIGLGHIHEAGLGVAQSDAEAAAWYRRGAEAGIARPTLRLVRLLLAQGGAGAASQWLEGVPAAAAANSEALNQYAWLRATSKSAAMRNGELALAQAQRALALERNASYLDTLAAAYAELGRFEEAVAAQRQALALAGAGSPLAAEFNVRLAAYLRSEPWRE